MSVTQKLTWGWLIKRAWQDAAHEATMDNRCWVWLDSHAMNGR